MHTWLLCAILAINALTFSAFGIDKWKARKARRRIPEARLLALAWATGLFGGWVGMSLFRHKTSKTPFVAKMIAVTVLNLLWVVIYLAVVMAEAPAA